METKLLLSITQSTLQVKFCALRGETPLRGARGFARRTPLEH